MNNETRCQIPQHELYGVYLGLSKGKSLVGESFRILLGRNKTNKRKICLIHEIKNFQTRSHWGAKNCMPGRV